jgi:hypothetical protein
MSDSGSYSEATLITPNTQEISLESSETSQEYLRQSLYDNAIRQPSIFDRPSILTQRPVIERRSDRMRARAVHGIRSTTETLRKLEGWGMDKGRRTR